MLLNLVSDTIKSHDIVTTELLHEFCIKFQYGVLSCIFSGYCCLHAQDNQVRPFLHSFRFSINLFLKMPPKTKPKTAALQLDWKEKLSEEGKLIVAAISEQLDLMRGEIIDKLEEKDAQISTLQEEVAVLKTSYSRLEERIDDADAYERRDTILISGSAIPSVTVGENCNALACDAIKNKLKLNVSSTDISTCHRTGKMPTNQQPDKRSIVVKLCRRELKRDILDACRALKPDNLYVNESLTQTRNTIMYALRRAKRLFPAKVSGCNSVDGRVFVWIRPPKPDTPGAHNTRMVVNTFQKLTEFCTKVLDGPLSTLIDINI